VAGEFIWNITEDHRPIRHLNTVADLDINLSVHSSFLRTAMSVLPSSSIKRSCKGSSMLSGKNITMSREETGCEHKPMMTVS